MTAADRIRDVLARADTPSMRRHLADWYNVPIAEVDAIAAKHATSPHTALQGQDGHGQGGGR